LPLGFRDHRADRFFIAHIGQQRMGRSAFGRDLRRHRAAILAIGDDDLGPFRRQRSGEDRTERGLRARGRTGDDRNLSFQTWHDDSFEFQRKPACTSSG